MNERRWLILELLLAVFLMLCGAAIALIIVLTVAVISAQGPPDSDGDGWSDGMEFYLGTSPTSVCIPYQNTGLIDAWPVDLNQDNKVDITDITLELQWFGVDVNRGYTDPALLYTGPRYDLAPEPMGDGQVDITDIVAVAGKFGGNCEAQ